MKDKLKPCPFCGGDAEILKVNEDKTVSIGEEAGVKIYQDKLLEIKTFFSLSISDLATIFQVSRPTIYGWFDGVETKPKNKARLEEINAIAKEYYPKLGRPLGKLAKQKGLSGKTILEYLVNSSAVSNRSIIEHLDFLIKKYQNRKESPGELARRLGIQKIKSL